MGALQAPLTTGAAKAQPGLCARKPLDLRTGVRTMPRRMSTVITAEAPTHLRCEYFENPLGIDARRPRLSWQLADARPGARQTAYQLGVASSPDVLCAGRPDLWDSSRV